MLTFFNLPGKVSKNLNFVSIETNLLETLSTFLNFVAQSKILNDIPSETVRSVFNSRKFVFSQFSIAYNHYNQLVVAKNINV